MSVTSHKTHYRTCNLCEAMCGLEITHNNNEIYTIKGDKKDPFSKGHICPKAIALQDLYNDPDRLRKPIKKVNGEWVEISWKEAFSLVTTKLKAIQNKHGKDAVAVYQGNPSVHNIGSMLYSSAFIKALNTKNRFSATSVDQLPHHFASQFMFGHSFLLPVPDINRTHYFLVLGGNPMVSNGSMMSVAGFSNKIRELQERGGKMIVVDPRMTETAEKSDQHVFIKPGTDVYFLVALLNELLVKNYIKVDDLPNWIKGADKLTALLHRFKNINIEELTGVPQKTVSKIAREFSESASAVCYGRMGVSTQEHGTLCQWLIYIINIITGNFDSFGGAMFTAPAIDTIKVAAPRGTSHQFKRWTSRVRSLPEFGGLLPVAALAEDCLTEGEGQIRALVTYAGNPVLSTPNGTKLEKALEGLDFFVAIDIYINETTKHADVILPSTTGLENEHFDLAFNTLAVHNTAKYSPPLFNLAKGALYDWQIFKALTLALNNNMSFLKKVLFKLSTPTRLLNIGLKKGPYPLTLKKLKQNQHGLDLGALKPCMPNRLFTKDKKVDLTPGILVEALNKLHLEAKDSTELHLIGRRHLRSNNSWMHNSERLVKGPNRCTIMINPIDAKKRNIEEGNIVAVQSGENTIHLPAELTEKLMPGVVSIPHGWGHNRSDTRWKVAESRAGVSINDLTDDQLIDEITGNAGFTGVKVEVALAEVTA
jgi:anaerobic selenocysteine-containing dehydrogenase